MNKDASFHDITFFNRFVELFGFQVPSHFLLLQTSPLSSNLLKLGAAHSVIRTTELEYFWKDAISPFFFHSLAFYFS